MVVIPGHVFSPFSCFSLTFPPFLVKINPFGSLLKMYQPSSICSLILNDRASFCGGSGFDACSHVGSARGGSRSHLGSGFDARDGSGFDAHGGSGFGIRGGSSFDACGALPGFDVHGASRSSGFDAHVALPGFNACVTSPGLTPLAVLLALTPLVDLLALTPVVVLLALTTPLVVSALMPVEDPASMPAVVLALTPIIHSRTSSISSVSFTWWF
jgi:hypothetical protein